jgi:hypothetical protein
MSLAELTADLWRHFGRRIVNDFLPIKINYVKKSILISNFKPNGGLETVPPLFA